MRKLSDVDEDTAAYIVQTRKPFEDLRQAAAQIAGVLVLSASGADTASPDHPLIAAASNLHREATDLLHGAHPTERACAHHHDLLEAAAELRAALDSAGKDLSTEAALTRLRRAYRHLQNSASSLPGFEMVAFAQGCCAIQRTPGIEA